MRDFLLTLDAWMSMFCLEMLKVLKPSPYLPVVALTDFWASLKFKLMLGCDLIKYNTVSNVWEQLEHTINTIEFRATSDMWLERPI